MYIVMVTIGGIILHKHLIETQAVLYNTCLRVYFLITPCPISVMSQIYTSMFGGSFDIYT